MSNFYTDNPDIEKTIDALDLTEVAELLEEDRWLKEKRQLKATGSSVTIGPIQIDEGDPMISGEDMGYLFLYEPTTNTSTLQSVKRQAEELVCGYPAPWAGKTARAWIFTVSRLSGKVSDSMALGRVSCE